MSIVEKKKANSLDRIVKFRKQLATIKELELFENLGIFVAGSYARNEASVYSDIDLFFVLDGSIDEVENPTLTQMRSFSRIIEEADGLQFPTFSNDGEFLRILEKSKMLRELGGRNDDYLNYFTARMLMLLESKPVYGEAAYNEMVKDIVGAYFRDYTHHPRDFRPVFLINDIIRFWKTLCLNYEHKRNQPSENAAQKTKQKVKNLKLKFSRMLTCFGSIAAIIDMNETAGIDEILSLRDMTPMERLEQVVSRQAILREPFSDLMAEYTWFLELTDVSGEELSASFTSEPLRNEAFGRAEVFGDAMYRIVHEVADNSGYLRYLVI